MKWYQQEVVVAGEPAVRVWNLSNDVEFMCGDYWDARDLIIALEGKALDMYDPDYGYEFDEFRSWYEAEQNSDRKEARIWQ
jgi:hypothetical protein